MEDVVSPADQQNMVASFLEIAVGQTAETARQFLQATGWKLEDAIQLFYVGNDGAPMVAASNSPPPDNLGSPANNTSVGLANDNGNASTGQEDEVRPPLPVIREALYADAMVYGTSRTGFSREASSVVAFRNFGEEMRRNAVWQSDQGSGAVTADNNVQDLASLYRPPFELMHRGPFEEAKVAASFEDKWLLVNLQSTKEFSSHMLNRDTWANEAVAQTIKTNFIFWQVYDDSSEGRKVCTYYKVDSVPVVIVIDPITGQKMRAWSGMVHPDRLLEDLIQFMDGGPKDHHVTVSHKRPRDSGLTMPQKFQQAPVYAHETDETDVDEEMQKALAMSMESVKNPALATCSEKEIGPEIKEEADFSSKKLTFPILPEEPTGDRNLICRVGVRLPDGRRVQRCFLQTDPIQLLWSFCCSVVEEAISRPFRLAQAIPGSSKQLEYEMKLSFKESGLGNSMISMTWD
uniref:UBX domain-containing protein n=1 Tax=Kalanchoe fedtschenkoi TaxID=63787 RepID=A0A7N0VC67_KALFE